MMTLYHGSYLEVNTPLAKIGRKNLDFGQGFYVTEVEQQSKDWAAAIAAKRGRRVTPVVSVYEFDRSKALADNIRFKIFDSYNLEWLQFVVDCRNGRDVYSCYDVIDGGIADDKVIDTVEDYEKGIITAEQAIGQLKMKEVNHQMCILNQAVIDKYLTFIRSFTL